MMTRRTLLQRVATVTMMIVLTLGNTGCNPNQGLQQGKAKETVYDRIMRTKKIRAAWLTYPPAAMKDTKTGKMTGIFVDTLEAMAKNMGLEVEWMQGETPWGTQI